VVFHAAFLILATFFDEVMDSRLTTHPFFQFIAIVFAIFLMILTHAAFTLFTNPSQCCCYYDYLLIGSMVSTALSAAQGATGCAATPTCLSLDIVCRIGAPIDDMIRPIISGVAFDTVT
jgi:quinol-cytochrome oxidoreductase complex cytochrome b subunit